MSLEVFQVIPLPIPQKAIQKTLHVKVIQYEHELWIVHIAYTNTSEGDERIEWMQVESS